MRGVGRSYPNHWRTGYRLLVVPLVVLQADLQGARMEREVLQYQTTTLRFIKLEDSNKEIEIRNRVLIRVRSSIRYPNVRSAKNITLETVMWRLGRVSSAVKWDI